MSEFSGTPTPSVLLIGGPDAGKSNFLYRFWLAVDSGGGMLEKDNFPDELEYLRTGLESLLRGAFAGRTSKEVLEHVTIPVKSAHNAAQTGVLNVPDVPGEKILEVYRLRQWSSLWEDRICEGCGCLMFIRAASDEIVRPLDYTECLATFGGPLPGPAAQNGAHQAQLAVRNDNSPNADAKSTADAPMTFPEPPTDVVLTDWLQFLRRAFTERVGGTYRPRIGIVVAAWDAVPNDAQARPILEYLGENFPLLRQFIETNDERFNFQVFGLSILGGDLKHDLAFTKQFRQGTPNEFGYVIHSINGTLTKVADVTVPVAWALGWFPTAVPPEVST